MSRTSTLSSVEIDVAEKSQRAAVLDAEEPFRILVMGNFSGGAGRNRRPMEVDRDNFDQVLALVAPELRLTLSGVEAHVRFRDLDDFHPDQLLARVPLFQKMRDLRRRLSDDATFAGAVAELDPQGNPPARDLANISGSDLLDLMTAEAAPAPARSAAPAWDQMLRDLVARYATANPDPRQPEWVARMDRAITGEMRVLLHHPEFQALEAVWRGVHFLTRRLQTGEELKIYLMDLPQEEVIAGKGLADVNRALEQESMAVMVGLYSFGKNDEPSLELLSALAQNANVPILSGLAPNVVGIDETFEDLRISLKARWLGLALPRFLLRLPYGSATDEVESFGFEEMPESPQHERYLWGNPSIACAYLMGEAFSRYGWQMRPGIVQDIEGLPAHVYKVNDVSELKPCAEVLLSESSAELLLDRGFMPLASIKGSDRIRLVRFQSLAKPAAPLAGKWE